MTSIYMIEERATGMVDGYYTDEEEAHIRAGWWTNLLHSICEVKEPAVVAIIPGAMMLRGTVQYKNYLMLRHEVKQ